MTVPPQAPANKSNKAILILILTVGCLGVLFIGAIVAAIAIPNFLSARNRAASHHSMGALRQASDALARYHQQHGRYPAANSMAELARQLEAAGTPVPTTDMWGHELRYLCWPQSPQGCEHYTLASAGADGVFEQQDLSAYPGEQTPWGDHKRDIVMMDGYLLQYPGEN